VAKLAGWRFKESFLRVAWTHTHTKQMFPPVFDYTPYFVTSKPQIRKHKPTDEHVTILKKTVIYIKTG
jgi:hypothetical protein